MAAPGTAAQRRLGRTACHLRPSFSSGEGNIPTALLSEDALDFANADVTSQTEILYDPLQYSAFPHVIRLEGDELLLSLRQAPATSVFHHVHPRSIVTILRSHDGGRTWDTDTVWLRVF